ncbi:MAG: flagellar biosynthetic protein FliO [Sandaracinaceae bacterium]|nr:flagellar biosynthetic protein FliO [Sandaracinaceae bacterium]
MGGLLLQEASGAAALPGGYGAALLQTLFALLGVCILAWIVLKWGAKKGLGLGATGGRIRVIERTVLDTRRSLYLIEVGGRVLLIGADDGGAPSLLTEIDRDKLPPDDPARATTFAEVMKKFRRAQDEDKPS